jgi:hypothetical protein
MMTAKMAYRTPSRNIVKYMRNTSSGSRLNDLGRLLATWSSFVACRRTHAAAACGLSA